VTARFAAAVYLCAVLVGCQGAGPSPGPSASQNDNVIRGIRTAPPPGSGIEIELFSAQGFPVRNEIAVMRIGTSEFGMSRYPPGGDTRTLIFSLSREDFALLKNGDEVVVTYGRDSAGPRWSFGTLDKGRLDR